MNKYINGKKYDTDTADWLVGTKLCSVDFHDGLTRDEKAEHICSLFEEKFNAYFKRERDAEQCVMRFLPIPKQTCDNRYSECDTDMFRWQECLYKTSEGDYFRALVFDAFYDGPYGRDHDIAEVALLPFDSPDDAYGWACDNLTADNVDIVFPERA